jgi:hypothetical protein
MTERLPDHDAPSQTFGGVLQIPPITDHADQR